MLPQSRYMPARRGNIGRFLKEMAACCESDTTYDQLTREFALLSPGNSRKLRQSCDIPAYWGNLGCFFQGIGSMLLQSPTYQPTGQIWVAFSRDFTMLRQSRYIPAYRENLGCFFQEIGSMLRQSPTYQPTGQTWVAFSRDVTMLRQTRYIPAYRENMGCFFQEIGSMLLQSPTYQPTGRFRLLSPDSGTATLKLPA